MSTRKSVYQIIEADGKFSILLGILNQTPLGRVIQQDENPLTFFAPTDGAFYRMLQKKPHSPAFDAGKILIGEILGQHIIPGIALYTKDLRRRHSVTNLEGKILTIRHDDHRVFVGHAQILTPAATAQNGVVFAIDKVLLNQNIKQISSV
ncbi:MAG TPA: fasciclin domain-containing protein [Pyrinomonadaceae bacterium]|jgi:uncharacterized surface protein with fasciclin (FAS1) repeats